MENNTDTSAAISSEKRSSKEWQMLYPDVIVMDPDGWNRKDFEASWNEAITLEEYNKRVSVSTCIVITK